jgi:LmbE family N-acetylglucosaminyl deacetylase
VASLSVLIVVAHPDDEVLGCGGTVAALTAQGVKVQSCILSGQVSARWSRPELSELFEDIETAQRIVGAGEPILGDFPNIELNTVPHLRLVQFIEQAIISTGADTIFTHHPGDLNNDHLHTSLACQAAVRLFQRRKDVQPLKALYYMEIPSSTDWAFSGSGSEFRPDFFVELGESFLDAKIRAIAAYRGVMRPYPHPRSQDVLRALAVYRGGQAGLHYAEGFQTAFRAMRLTMGGDM